MVLGGARPPPQSRNSQSSPVPGTYQAREAPAGLETSVDVQPVRSVLARAREAREAVKKTVERRDILVCVVVIVYFCRVCVLGEMGVVWYYKLL